MRKISIFASLLSVVAIAAVASAGAGDKDKTKTTTTTTTTTKTTSMTGAGSASASGSASAAMTMPDPDPALIAAAKTMKGTYSCKGTQAMPDGSTMPMKGTVKWSQDLDKFWIRGDFTSTKAKGMKRAYKAIFYRTYSGGTWNHLSLDNMGGWGQATSTGPDSSNKVTFDGTMTMGGQSVKSHDYEQPGEKKGSMHIWGEMSMDGAKWMPTYDLTCTK